MAKGKYTRKQLKKPDEFISLSMKVWDFIKAQASRVVVMLLVAIVVVAAVWVWTYFAEQRAKKTTAALTRAFDIYTQTVIPTESKLPEGDDDIPRFKTREAKLKASVKEFTKVMETAGGDGKELARLMRAGVHFDQGSYAKAAQDYRAFLSSGPADPFRTAAIEGLAYSLEAQKKYDKALEQFRKLADDKALQWTARYHEARVLARKGDKKQAAKLLREVIDKAEDRTIVNRASDHLALVESK